MFYTDISSRVLINRYALRHLHLERKRCHGCRFSGTLFGTANELLAKSVRHSKEIKGIPVDENNNIKLAQYADDTTVLLSDD